MHSLPLCVCVGCLRALYYIKASDMQGLGPCGEQQPALHELQGYANVSAARKLSQIYLNLSASTPPASMPRPSTSRHLPAQPWPTCPPVACLLLPQAAATARRGGWGERIWRQLASYSWCATLCARRRRAAWTPMETWSWGCTLTGCW
jgi:hypothetical protein